MVKAGIIGAAGYTGGELIRVLLGHPDVHIVFAQSTSHAGEPLWKAHSDLVGETDIKFSADAPVMDVDVVRRSRKFKGHRGILPGRIQRRNN